ncbi:MAG TPA: DUF402 domain-containing protein [Anaerolineales bacterium]|nr:DUF402 domain-containing protein [Anaerolineales bacterium]
MKLWKPGQGIVLREVWRNKVYSIIPVRVVNDASSWSALYLPPRSSSLWPHTPEGRTIRIPTDEWVLDGGPWEGGDLLYLVQPGAGYTVTGVWDRDHILDHWKIDLVEPIRRTLLGFDYMDQLLDIIVRADRSTWRWKDEDEVQEAQERGIFTAEQVNDLYQRGERALQALQSKEPPFDRSWENWSPNPAWQVPFDLPDGWERV